MPNSSFTVKQNLSYEAELVIMSDINRQLKDSNIVNVKDSHQSLFDDLLIDGRFSNWNVTFMKNLDNGFISYKFESISNIVSCYLM